MSITVEYLFNFAATLPELTPRINDALNCSLTAYNGDADDQFCRFLGMELSLHADHGLESDGDLNFSDYQYVLSSRTPAGDSVLRAIQVETMGIAAFVLRQKIGIAQGMLTFAVQRLLARYDDVDRIWTDSVSRKAVRFPDHLMDISTRARWDR